MTVPALLTAPTLEPVTLAEIKTHIGVFFDDDDVMLQSILDDAVSMLDGYHGDLQRCLMSQIWTTSHAAFCGTMYSPFPDLTAVVVKYTDTEGVVQTVDGSDYFRYEDHIKFKSTFSYPSLQDENEVAILIQWTCGQISKVTLNSKLKRAIKMIAAHWYANREAVVPNERRTSFDQLPLGAKHLVQQFRVWK